MGDSFAGLDCGPREAGKPSWEVQRRSTSARLRVKLGQDSVVKSPLTVTKSTVKLDFSEPGQQRNWQLAVTSGKALLQSSIGLFTRSAAKSEGGTWTARQKIGAAAGQDEQRATGSCIGRARNACKHSQIANDRARGCWREGSGCDGMGGLRKRGFCERMVPVP